LAQAEGDDREAEAILRQGMQTFPEDAILKRVLNNTLMRLGREKEAWELMRNL
jgi:predicted Zn-dependent protease